ncbi:MAG: DUF924 family protein [Novosphingobium sp.]
MNAPQTSRPWADVLDFWFPEGCAADVSSEVHLRHWSWRMHGGADRAIVARFAELTELAASGGLDHWALDVEGRLALIVVLDQFPRSLWRDSPRAFAQDAAALELAMAGLENGHYAALRTPWGKIAHTQPLGHCEGPDHLDRIDLLIRLREEVAASAPDQLQPIYRSLVDQARAVREVIAVFGRHPHRNPVLGRQSTLAEQTYIAKGGFPHSRVFRA